MVIICNDKKRERIKRKIEDEKENSDNNPNNKPNNNSNNSKLNNSPNKSKPSNNSNNSKLNNNPNNKPSNNSNNNPNKSKPKNNSNKSRSNNYPNEQIENDIAYGTPEELQLIINSLLERKKFLENKYGSNLNTQKNDNEKPNSLKDYQLMIDKLSKEVFELEKINNIWNIQNKNTQINFFLSTGEKYIINVDSETKLGDAFQNAVINGQFNLENYEINMNNKTHFSDAYSSTNLSKEKFNYEQTIFLSGGKNISDNFRNNEPVSSLHYDLNSPISILVNLPL